LPTFKLDFMVSYAGHALSCDHFKQMCAATDNITSELFVSREAQ